MVEKAKMTALANEMMEAFQREGLSYKEVNALLAVLNQRVDESRQRAWEALDGYLFKALPF